MRGTLIVALREIVERRAILLAAAFAGLLPFASPLLPGIGASRAGEARDAMAIVLAVASSLGVALLMGASVVARDLSEGRLGFDFARPLGGGAIWAGRFLGAAVLTYAVLGIVLLPAGLVGGWFHGMISDPGYQPWWYVDAGQLATPTAFLAILLTLLPLAHVVSVAFRSRSAWLALDMSGLLATLLVAVLAGRRLLSGFAILDLAVSTLVVSTLVIPALWIASAAQLLQGRTDLKRGHRIQSLVLWSILFGLALCYDAYSRFVVSAGPRDLVQAVAVSSAPRGSWISITGSAWGRGDFAPSFLMDTATGRSLPLGGGDPWFGRAILFSGDGRRAVWIKAAGPGEPRFDVLWIDLEHEEAGFHETPISFETPWMSAAVSEDGSRMALLEGTSFSVYEVEGGKLLASFKLETAGHDPRLYFADADHVRLILHAEGIDFYELHVARKTLGKTGSSPFVAQSYLWVLTDPVRDRLLVRDLGLKGRTALLDARSGATLREFEAPPGGAPLHGFRFLADGCLVFGEQDAGKSTLRSITPDGVESVVDLGVAEKVAIGGEIEPGKIAVVAPAQPQSRVLVVDVASGQIREIARGLHVSLPEWVRSHGPAAPGSVRTRIFEAGGALIDLDPATGRQRVLTGSRSGKS